MKILVILGPTATGKTAMAVRLARRYHGEIISADSRQVYRGLDLGTGKDLSEYGTGADFVPHHLIDIRDPGKGDPFSLADFMREAKEAVRDISARGKLPVLCGGTALYLHALMKGYDLPGGPADRAFRESLRNLSVDDLAARQDPGRDLTLGEAENPYRLTRKLEIGQHSQDRASSGGPLPGAEYLVLGTFRPREETRRRVALRLDERLNAGMIREVETLHRNGVSWEVLDSYGLEYRYVSLYLQEKMTFPEMRDLLCTRICQFVKRQDTFFRKMEREGIVIHWLDPADESGADALLKAFLSGTEISLRP